MDAPGGKPRPHRPPAPSAGVAEGRRGSASSDHEACRGGPMTHSIDAPLPPPATTGTGSPSTSDVAKDQAKNVGQTAAQAGGQVASTATDQAKHVAQETQRQAKDLLDQGRSQLRGLADGSSQGAPGPARDLLHQASSSVENFASMLQNREPADLLDEVRAFARRKPGLFLLGAAAAGVLAGRL